MLSFLLSLEEADGGSVPVMNDTVRGPQSYFPSIEATYGKPVEHWFCVLEGHKDKAHMEMVAELKTAHGLGHGHANALVAYFRAQTPTS